MYIMYLYFIKHSDLQTGRELDAYSEECHPVNHRGDFQRHAGFSFHLQLCSQVCVAGKVDGSEKSSAIAQHFLLPIRSPPRLSREAAAPLDPL